MIIKRDNIEFTFRRDSRYLAVTAQDGQGNIAYGNLANSEGASPRIYPRLEFYFDRRSRWIEPLCDHRYWHLDDYETHEEAEKRPFDSGTFDLTKDEQAALQAWCDAQIAAAPPVAKPPASPSATSEWQTLDIDSGLGIGGINNDQSMPVIPSAEAIGRVQRMHDTDTVCRRCGASKHFDGAMFSTLGDICDDCAA